ncbi:MAG: proton-conducting transporter membrane subunit, partial [Cyclobacteriaceae bacterium]|nr:proton-conducting transporter membrane subunit [Cyclobacteriaceae bacterium]
MLDTIEAIRLSFYGLSAELYIGTTLIVLLLCSAVPALRKDYILLGVSLVGLLFYFYALLGYEEGSLFNGMLVNTNENILLRKLFFFATVLALFQVAYQRENLTQDKKLPEYLTMMFSIVLGGSLLVASRHFLMIFIAIELLSITAYIFTTLPLSMTRIEAAIKYLIFGGVSSGVMLYGISLIYATTGSLYINSDVLLSGLAHQEIWIVLVVWIMIFSGVLFKLAAFPMHVWSPDVYQAVPSMSAAFITTVPKLAAFGLIISLIPTLKATMGDTIWYEFLSVIAIITITAGNLGALRQQNVRRMLAYSSISHTGFLMVGLVAIDFEGLKNFM